MWWLSPRKRYEPRPLGSGSFAPPLHFANPGTAIDVNRSTASLTVAARHRSARRTCLAKLHKKQPGRKQLLSPGR